MKLNDVNAKMQPPNPKIPIQLKEFAARLTNCADKEDNAFTRQ